MTEPEHPAPTGEEAALSGPSLEAPDAAYTSHRWIPKRTVEWVREADRIMLEHGAVQGRSIVGKRYQARWRAQRLIRLMEELGLHARWELAEHTEKAPGGWTWLVEYRGGSK